MLDLATVIPKLQTWADATPLVRALVIFGSYARGTAHEGSDLDLALIIDAENGDGDPATTWFFRHGAWTEELTRLLGFDRVQLEWLDADETPTVVAGVEASRVVVYRRASACR